MAVRIDPNEGDEVVIGGVTNRVGAADMVVELGEGSDHDPHEGQYKVAARPYNYSDMTGFNNRVVNPGLEPFKGYWMAVNDSGSPGQLWSKISWNATVPNGCSIEVFVRAADERTWLGSETWVQATNDAFFPSIRGRYVEVRLAMTRDEAGKQPVIYDLTLYGTSSGFAGDFFLDDARVFETEDAVFYANIAGAEPMGYQWFRMYPWETNWVEVAGATSSYFAVTNVDSWVDSTMAKCYVTNGAGESFWLGPALVEVWPLGNAIPASGSSGLASRYPMSINVFGQPADFNSVTVAVSVWNLSHTRTADIGILLISPSDKGVVLVSNVGGTNGVSNASLRFLQSQSSPSQTDPIPSGQTSVFKPSNYGQITQMPRVGNDPPPVQIGTYSMSLDDLKFDNPNGVWKLYIYDFVKPGGAGQLTASWSLDLVFQ
ncbi:MAG TPA: hypothetical protein VN673_06100 [Clostridia bacterium]|nr:hypothetical protein [Clostridia bacterium]